MTGHDRHQCALSAPARPNDAHHFSPPDFEADVVQGTGIGTEVVDQILDLEGFEQVLLLAQGGVEGLALLLATEQLL